MCEQKRPKHSSLQVRVKPSEVLAMSLIADTYRNMVDQTIAPSMACAEVLETLSSFLQKCHDLQQRITQNEQAGDNLFATSFAIEEMMVFATAVVYYSRMVSLKVAPSSLSPTPQEALDIAMTFQQRYLEAW